MVFRYIYIHIHTNYILIIDYIYTHYIYIYMFLHIYIYLYIYIYSVCVSLISPVRSLFYNVTLVKHVFFVKHAHTIDIWGSKGGDGENAYPTVWKWNG